MTIWDCRTHVRMTSSGKRTDLDFKISVALVMSDEQKKKTDFRKETWIGIFSFMHTYDFVSLHVTT